MYIKTARQIVISYFECLALKDKLSSQGFSEIYKIKSDKTNARLLFHLKVMRKIINNAIEEIEETRE